MERTLVQKIIWLCKVRGEMPVDEIAASLHAEPWTVAITLLRMQLHSLARCDGGRWFVSGGGRA